MSSFPRIAALPLCFLLALVAACTPAQNRIESPDPSAVTADDLQNSSEPIEVTLQKKVPGLVVRRTDDGGIALEIRGGTWDGTDKQPLYVLDGMPFTPGPGGALTAVNPYEIESIKVLKSSEAGLYGIDGAHGVIVITTKKPGRRTP